MRTFLAVFVLLALAGCSSNAPPAPTQPVTGPGGWTVDCSLGGHEPGPWVHDCVGRASHSEGPKQEIWLAVNPNDPDNVVIGSKDLRHESSNECVWNGLAVTHDGGTTWKDVVIGGSYANRAATSPYFGFSCNTDPMLQFAKDGTVYYAVEMYNVEGDSHGPLGPDPVTGRPLLLPGWKLVLALSHDGGNTWPESEAITLDQSDGVAAINDYSRMTVSPKTGTVLEAINTFSGGPFAVAGAAYTICDVTGSRDGGKTAFTPVKVTGNVNPGDASSVSASFGCQAIAAAPDGTIVLAGGGPTTAWSWSADDGRTFSPPVPGFTYQTIPGVFPESKYRTGTNFELAYDYSNGTRAGTLYVLYADSSDGNNADEYVRASADNGHTWSHAVKVNDDAGTANQFMGNLVVAEDGSVHAFFMDKRWDPAGKLIDITHAVSLDGGLSWSNERLTKQSFDGDLGKHQEGFPFIGDYNGVGTAKNVVWAGFPDATVGTTVIAAARVVKN